jgi:outer membrane receptor protein involved in Fe transport
MPALATLDVRVSRTVALADSKLELMLDVFNLFNRSNVAQVQNVRASSTPPYGTATGYGPRRQVQFGARYRF